VTFSNATVEQLTKLQARRAVPVILAVSNNSVQRALAETDRQTDGRTGVEKVGHHYGE